MYTLTQWIMRTASLDYCGDQDILQMHQELHNDFGEAPTEGIVGCEQAIVTEMQKRSFEHRHFDALSKAAGTLVENPSPADLYEVGAYLRRTVRLQDGVVSLVKGLEAGDVFLKVEGGALAGLEGAILKMFTKWLPPGIVLKPFDQAKADGSSFAETMPTHDLELEWSYGGRRMTTWEALGINITIVAAKSAPGIFFEGKAPRIPFRVVKADAISLGRLFPEDSVYVFGPTLIPGKIDTTTTFPDGTPTGAIGDRAEAPAIRGAFEFWTSAKRAFEVHHEFAAGPQGRSLDESEIVMLDNFTAPIEMQLTDRDGKPEVFPAGTWFQGARILDAQYAKQALERRLNSWSIYANCLGKMEEQILPS